MLGRRSHTRVTITEGAEGVLRLARAVGVSERADGEWIATSREAGVLGETVAIALLDEGRTLSAQIVESKPIVTDGAVRHRLWLRRVDSDRLVGASSSKRDWR
jgi:hypothetical protein